MAVPGLLLTNKEPSCIFPIFRFINVMSLDQQLFQIFLMVVGKCKNRRHLHIFHRLFFKIFSQKSASISVVRYKWSYSVWPLIKSCSDSLLSWLTSDWDKLSVRFTTQYRSFLSFWTVKNLVRAGGRTCSVYLRWHRRPLCSFRPPIRYCCLLAFGLEISGTLNQQMPFRNL